MAAMNGSTPFDGTPPAVNHDAIGSPSTVTTPGNHSHHNAGDGSVANTPYVPVQNGRKRKADGTSSRGVANLTPEQLAKKRANDREAQRAIRERTKNTIENLERRIKELESQQPFQELQNVIRLRDAVLAENDDLKRRMQSILSLLQPLAASSQGLNGQSRHVPAAHIIALADGSDLAAATARQSPLPMPLAQAQTQQQQQQQQQVQQQQQQQAPPLYQPPQQTQSAQQPQPLQPAAQLQQSLQPAQQQQQQQQPQQPQHAQYDHSFQQHHLHPDLRNNNQPSPTMQRPLSSPSNVPAQHDSRRWSPSSASAPTQYHSPSQLPQSAYQPDLGPQMDRYSLHHLVDHHLKPTSPSSVESRSRDLVPLPTNVPLYTRLPLNTEPTCTLDSILGGFEAERQRAAQAGTPTASLVGPPYPSISSLLNPTRAVDSHPLSKVFTDILAKFPSISDVPEQIAVLYIMFLVMRWHIAPTQENFERLPEWVRPVRSQLEIPHPAWIDHLPWPMMRDRITRASNVSAYPFETFFVPYTTTLSLNWPYEHSQCLISTASPTTAGAEGNTTPRPGSSDATSAVEIALHGTDEGQEFAISPVFESHLRNLNNWSLGTAFADSFPDLVDDVRIRNVRPQAPTQPL